MSTPSPPPPPPYTQCNKGSTTTREMYTDTHCHALLTDSLTSPQSTAKTRWRSSVNTLEFRLAAELIEFDYDEHCIASPPLQSWFTTHIGPPISAQLVFGAKSITSVTFFARLRFVGIFRRVVRIPFEVGLMNTKKGCLDSWDSRRTHEPIGIAPI